MRAIYGGNLVKGVLVGMAGVLVLGLGMVRGEGASAVGGWTEVTGKMGSVVSLACSPGEGLVVAGVMKAGFFGSTDGGATWNKLGAGDKEQIQSLCTDILFDPKDGKTFWVSGAYARSIFKTVDGGKTFEPISALWHMDNIAVDFSDPERKVMMSAMHETPGRLYRTTDGGKSWWNVGKPRVGYEGFPGGLGVISPAILDSKHYIMGCWPGWLSAHGFKPGIVVTEDGGETWEKVSDFGPEGHPLVASDGGIYWRTDRGVIKSGDKGKTWAVVEGAGVTPVELAGGKLLSAKGRQLVVSGDGGKSWEKVGVECKEGITMVTYSAALKAVFVLGRSGGGASRVYRMDWKEWAGVGGTRFRKDRQMGRLVLVVVLAMVMCGVSARADAPGAKSGTGPAGAPTTGTAMTQEQVVAEITKLGAEVERKGGAPDGMVVVVRFNFPSSKAVTDEILGHLKALDKLQSLMVMASKVTDAGLVNLGEMDQLQSLYLDRTAVTDAGLVHLKGLKQLRELGLRETKVTDAGLEVLTGLVRLEALHLSDTKVTDAGLEQLKAFKQLKSLDLERTKVTDGGLEKLKGLEQLQRLYLDKTEVTDAGLAYLKGLTNLHFLRLSSSKVTDEGVKKLQAALPDCKIVR